MPCDMCGEPVNALNEHDGELPICADCQKRLKTTRAELLQMGYGVAVDRQNMPPDELAD